MKQRRDGEPNDAESKSVLGRAGAVMNLFLNGESVLGLHDLTERTGLPRSTAHRLAERLVDLGWLERIPTGYRLGLQLFELGCSVPTPTKLRNAAAPWLRKANEATNLAIHLALLDGCEVVYVDIVRSVGLKLPSRIGGRMPAVSTGLGKVLLAYASGDQLGEALHGNFRGRTTHSVTSEEKLQMTLAQIREDGFAVNRSETVKGVSCVAAPLRGSGRAIGAISVTAPTARFEVTHLKRVVQATARGIWSDMFPR
jgi:DNA-binding IclR family transcriptional regulator